ncbi:MAG: hypothetical protein EPO08_15720 [Rhodospirillaceae bacterium]|nr:MAG: hypothetical protein EPO08_15720 [Rhodospirillaceae bacterium]
MTSQAATQMPIPPLPAVENYGPAMARFALAAMRHAAPLNPDAPRIVMYLTPWYRQAAAWFAVSLGIAIAARAGARVEFLINDLPYPAIHPFELNEVAALDTFCREFEALFPSYRLSAFASATAPSRKILIDSVVDEGLRLDLRHRIGGGTLARGNAASFKFSAHTPLTHITAACDRFLAAEHPDVLFCPGGVANGSYVVRRLADIHGVRFASCDSGFENLFLASHSIAGHLIENAETYDHLLTLPPGLAATAQTRGFETLAAKVRAAAANPATLPPCSLVLPLGYDWDTVALGIGSLYETQTDWLRDTVDYVDRTHPQAHMVVRQHPYEATFPSPENLDLITELEQRRPANLHVMRAAHRVPIYGLLQNANACVACQSTTVLEAQMLGVPAVSMRDTYYVAAGAVTRPPTREAYFAWLDEQLSGARGIVPQAAREAAALDYFILESCMMDVTRFTPHASDLWTWLHSDPAADMRTEAIGDMVRCVVADVPVSTLKARRALGLPPLPDGIADPVAA